MVKQNKIRDWETKRDDLNNKLEVCEEKLRNPQQEQRPEDFKVSEGLLTAAIGELCVWTLILIMIQDLKKLSKFNENQF